VALLADQSADANSNLVQGTGTNSLTFTMPGTVALNVQSVVATINNAAGADTTAELTVRDQSGVVIATKRQGEVIPAADTGTATFALRLSDDGGGIRYGVHNSGSWLAVGTTTIDGFTGDTGAGKAVTFTMPNTANGGSLVVVNSTGDTVFDAGGDNAGNYGCDLRADGTGSLQFVSPFELHTLDSGIGRFTGVTLMDFSVEDFNVSASTSVNIATANASIGIDTNERVLVVLDNGQPMTVLDHLGNEIFRVDEDGDLHGLTGKTLTFDL
jgi:hypothetical protein